MTLTSPRPGRAEGISVLPGLRTGAPPAGPAALAGVPGRVVRGYAAVLAWLLAPLGWRRGLILAPFFVSELLLGNVYLLFAASLVMSLGRLPGAVALPALTKVAPGVLAVWFVVLGEWRWLAWAAGTTAAIVLVSVLLAPEAWVRWVQFLGTSAGERGLGSTVRLVASLGLVVWAARRHQAWLLAPALILACPVLGGYGPLAVMAPVPRLRQWGRTDQAEPGRQTGDTRVVTS